MFCKPVAEADVLRGLSIGRIPVVSSFLANELQKVLDRGRTEKVI
jgi:hypothetical protein